MPEQQKPEQRPRSSLLITAFVRAREVVPLIRAPTHHWCHVFNRHTVLPEIRAWTKAAIRARVGEHDLTPPLRAAVLHLPETPTHELDRLHLVTHLLRFDAVGQPADSPTCLRAPGTLRVFRLASGRLRRREGGELVGGFFERERAIHQHVV